MKKIVSFLILTASCGFGSLLAWEPFCFSNFYIDGFGGINFVESRKEGDVRVDLNSGYAVGGVLGYKLWKCLKLEVEAGYRSNTFEQIVVQGAKFSASGHLKKTTLMANGIMEFPLCTTSLVPYIGAGIGERWDKESFTLDPIVVSGGILVFDTLVSEGKGLAYQGLAGLTFYNDCRIEAGVEYRYLNGPHLEGNHTVDLKVALQF